MLPTVGVGARPPAGTANTSAVGTLPTTTEVGVIVPSYVASAVAVARSLAINSTARGAIGGILGPPFHGE